ncbi:hypothetical protein IU449_10260 [Nocardia higoensis]|uniref:H repeat-associated protein N-terminal domain-containing protein n=1 Tax=Nocardia higoensis TaxID=228599 RepID=A0ABS0D8X9_9NOCA|nr:hypothetical protein [Nocardia higoensis]
MLAVALAATVTGARSLAAIAQWAADAPTVLAGLRASDHWARDKSLYPASLADSQLTIGTPTPYIGATRSRAAPLELLASSTQGAARVPTWIPSDVAPPTRLSR